MNQSKTQTTKSIQTTRPNSNLVKQILDCCQMYPAAPALNLVPQATVLRAARKAGLVGDYNQLRWCQRRIEQFIAECFLQVAEQNNRISKGWFKVLDKELTNYGIFPDVLDTEQQAKAKLEKAMNIYCTLPTEENMYEGDML